MSYKQKWWMNMAQAPSHSIWYFFPFSFRCYNDLTATQSWDTHGLC